MSAPCPPMSPSVDGGRSRSFQSSDSLVIVWGSFNWRSASAWNFATIAVAVPRYVIKINYPCVRSTWKLIGNTLFLIEFD